jgi:hypothetical protein
MSDVGTHDEALLDDQVTAGKLPVVSAGVSGPDPRDARSIQKRRRRARWGLPTLTPVREARCESSCTRVAVAVAGGDGHVAVADGAPKCAIDVTTVWCADPLPAKPGA